ncbi:metallophosphoesterase [Weissella diestrammenae]|uniref:Metallophosphoesterase n=1 Tax=Weissella diestrammenae TaxID=1162633 RepID=A0A7G9T738_9LACO|nr:metallophosphoesterase [Weissella diestrammenae]MCM0582488.1 metallophosphoesterase [Weissella diestrammenae]QNN75913.1 metallophosphoesterase [Weissella diestrammenae]
MMKIAVSSDNHFDVNRLDVSAMIDAQAAYLLQQRVDVYLIAGDLFNSFEKSLDYVTRLQTAVGTQVLVRFIAGNHDMGRDVSFDELETALSPYYFHHQTLDLGNWQIIGNNGWYDYSFASGPDRDQIVQFKRGLYYDRVIEQPMTDPERTQLSLKQLGVQLDAAQTAGKKVIIIQHFAPHGLDLSYPQHVARWLMINGVMGSNQYAQLYAQYPNVQQVYYGHTHQTLLTRHLGTIAYNNVSVGYQRARIPEWTAETFIESWKNKIRYKVLTND